MALDLNKTELRELIRDLIQKELKSTAFKKTVEDVVSDEVKDGKVMTEKEVRDTVRQMLVSFYKLMYQRQSFWSNAL